MIELTEQEAEQLAELIDEAVDMAGWGPHEGMVSDEEYEDLKARRDLWYERLTGRKYSEE